MSELRRALLVAKAEAALIPTGRRAELDRRFTAVQKAAQAHATYRRSA